MPNASWQSIQPGDLLTTAQGLQNTVLGTGLGLSPSSRARSKRLELGFSGKGGVALVLGKLGG